MRVERGPGWELRLGDWREVLREETADVLITDPPYSKRQIAGFRSGSDWRRGTTSNPELRRHVIPYSEITEEEVRDLAGWTMARVEWWAVVFGDHVLWSWLERWFGRGLSVTAGEEIEDLPEGVHGAWATFAPVVWTKPNPPPRMAADGPACAAEHLLIARPRRRLPAARRGSRPGLYHVAVTPSGGASRGLGRERLVGEKPLELMRAIVRDYTLPGDLIAEPYAGTGTTLAAALFEGRRAIGAEVDPGRFELAVRRLEADRERFEFAARQAALFPEPSRARQLEMNPAGEEESDRC